MTTATLTGQATEVEKTPAELILEAAERYRVAEASGPRWEGAAAAWLAWDDLTPGQLGAMLGWLPTVRSEGVSDRGPGVAFVATVIGAAEGEPIRRPAKGGAL